MSEKEITVMGTAEFFEEKDNKYEVSRKQRIQYLQINGIQFGNITSVNLVTCGNEITRGATLDVEMENGLCDLKSAIEKQIPKIINMNDEIKYLDGQSVGWVCPTCNIIIFDFGIYDYCPHCGQKLEWRDDNIEAESN